MAAGLNNKTIGTAFNFGLMLIFSSTSLMDNLMHITESKHFILETSVLENPTSFFQLQKRNDPTNIPSPKVTSKMTKTSDDVKQY